MVLTEKDKQILVSYEEWFQLPGHLSVEKWWKIPCLHLIILQLLLISNLSTGPFYWHGLTGMQLLIHAFNGGLTKPPLKG